jgi:glyoxylase-like metal-dependent hydrolase (beta-lactamase superfamily II)
VSIWREVGDRVWVRRYDSLDQTIGVIGGDSGLIVVDTRASHRLADELRAELAELAGAVVGVVNTHGHWDHVFGNARFASTPIWGHVRCATMITEHGEEQRAHLIDRYPPEVAEQFREVELTPPTELVTETATLDLGDRQVELRHLGRGHTDNDIVVRVPDANVLFAGDLLENDATPYFGDGFPIDWPATAERLVELATGAVVPGHGSIGDRAFAVRQMTEFRAVAELATLVHDGRLGIDAAVLRTPYPADTAREPLERALAQLRGELD